MIIKQTYKPLILPVSTNVKEKKTRFVATLYNLFKHKLHIGHLLKQKILNIHKCIELVKFYLK